MGVESENCQVAELQQEWVKFQISSTVIQCIVWENSCDACDGTSKRHSMKQLFPYRGFPTGMVHLHYISCLRYTILVRNPRYTVFALSFFFSFSVHFAASCAQVARSSFLLPRLGLPWHRDWPEKVHAHGTSDVQAAAVHVSFRDREYFDCLKVEKF